MIELNISCPNIKEGGLAFGVENEQAQEVVRAVRKATTRRCSSSSLRCKGFEGNGTHVKPKALMVFRSSIRSKRWRLIFGNVARF